MNSAIVKLNLSRSAAVSLAGSEVLKAIPDTVATNMNLTVADLIRMGSSALAQLSPSALANIVVSIASRLTSSANIGLSPSALVSLSPSALVGIPSLAVRLDGNTADVVHATSAIEEFLSTQLDLDGGKPVK